MQLYAIFLPKSLLAEVKTPEGLALGLPVRKAEVGRPLAFLADDLGPPPTPLGPSTSDELIRLALCTLSFVPMERRAFLFFVFGSSIL